MHVWGGVDGSWKEEHGGGGVGSPSLKGLGLVRVGCLIRRAYACAQGGQQRGAERGEPGGAQVAAGAAGQHAGPAGAHSPV